MIGTIPVVAEHLTSETKCGYCTNSKCCTYITQELPTPRSKQNFDHLLWQISHKNVSIYKDDERWFLLVDNACLHLMPGGRCAIYEQRPQVCRDYSNNHCEFDDPAEKHFELHFTSHDELLNYCKKRFKRWGG